MIKTKNTDKTGLVVGASSMVVDVQFPGRLPAIRSALEVILDGASHYLEVLQHIGSGIVRCLTTSDVSGIRRGDNVRDLEAPLFTLVGKVMMGRILYTF